MFRFLCSAIYSTIVQKSSCNKSSAIRLLLENSFFTSPLRRIINLPALFHKVFPRFSAYTSFTIFLEIKHGLAERICHLTKDGGSNRDHNLVSPATIIRLKHIYFRHIYFLFFSLEFPDVVSYLRRKIFGINSIFPLLFSFSFSFLPFLLDTFLLDAIVDSNESFEGTLSDHRL